MDNAPKVTVKQEVEQRSQVERQAQNKRREVTEAARDKQGQHPFGRRNKLLCEARKLRRDGRNTDSMKKAEEANQIAPLTDRERQNIDRA